MRLPCGSSGAAAYGGYPQPYGQPMSYPPPYGGAGYMYPYGQPYGAWHKGLGGRS